MSKMGRVARAPFWARSWSPVRTGDGRRDPRSHGPNSRPLVLENQDVVACLHAASRATASIPSRIPATEQHARGGQAAQPDQRRRSQSRSRALLSRAPSAGKGRRAREEDEPRGDPGPSEGKGGDSIVLSPGLVADTAVASLNLHSGILLLEDGIARSCKSPEAPSAAAASAARRTTGRRQGHGRDTRGAPMPSGAEGSSTEAPGFGDAAHQDSWLQLSRLYAALGERDVLVGVSARASRIPGTRYT